MNANDKMYDLAVLGAGPGGYVAAIRAAQLGFSVALVEKDPYPGGTCLHRGCIPTKAMLASAEVFDQVRRAERFGVRAGAPEVDVAGVHRHKASVVRRLATGLEGLLRRHGVELVRGRGRLAGRGLLLVEGDKARQLKARHILLATGSTPAVPPPFTVDGRRVLTSDEVLHLPSVPASLLVIGAGAVGVEFASLFCRFGSRVTLVEMLPRVLPAEDEEISSALEASLKRQGIEVLTGTVVEEVVPGDPVTVRARRGQEVLERQAEILLVATGRRPATEGLGLQEMGVEMEGARVRVDEFMRTSVVGLYAIGDLVPGPQLAHVASAEGILAVEHMAGREVHPLDYDKTPSATYCHPEVASVGLSERRAVEAGYDVKVGRFPFAALGKAVLWDDTEGFVKVVAEARYGEVLGVHILGPHATDLIAEAVVALQCEATLEELFRSVHPHPTLSEAIAEAAHGADGSPLHFLPPPPRKRPVPA
jgi:dihydrolipoamide dehydrogenase